MRMPVIFERCKHILRNRRYVDRKFVEVNLGDLIIEKWTLIYGIGNIYA